MKLLGIYSICLFIFSIQCFGMDHKLKIGLSAFSLKEDAFLSRGTSASFETKFSFDVDENVKLNLIPFLSFISGAQSSRDPQTPLTNSFYLKDASAEINVADKFRIFAGGLYQKNFLPGIAGHTKAFPAIAFKLPMNMSNHSFELNGQASVPTSSGLATNSSELESSTSLFSSSLELNSHWSEYFETKINLSHFIYSRLSSAAALDSIIRGNSVVKVSSSSAYFLYKYNGNELNFKSTAKINDKTTFIFNSSFIQNNSAPTDLNQGYFLSLNPGYVWSNDLKVSVKLEYFKVDSDAIVSVFSDSSYGRTNRRGKRVCLVFEKTKYNFEVNYSRSSLIQSNAFQSKDHSIFINWDILGLSI